MRDESRSFKKWTKEENRKYAEFLRDNQEEFEEGKERRTLYFFNKMAAYLDIGKDNLQCRSHHQKMLLRFKTMPGIIKGILGGKKKKQVEVKIENEVSNEENFPINHSIAPIIVPFFMVFFPQEWYLIFIYSMNSIGVKNHIFHSFSFFYNQVLENIENYFPSAHLQMDLARKW